MNILALVWVGIIAFGIIMYVILDGFDLGIGIISIFFDDKQDRDIMVSTILPLWDGNETWLVFGGAALYGAFPLAFSMILPAIYLPIMIMVIGLLLRGVAFEFRLKVQGDNRLWDWCFFLGSIVMAFMQGVILGVFVAGFNLNPQNLTLDVHQWLNPFGCFCGIALVFGYSLLGSNRLIAKTTGPIQDRCYHMSQRLQYIILAMTIIASIWSPFLDGDLIQRWFDPTHMRFLAILPIATLIIFIIHVMAIKKKQEHVPFWSAVGIFLMCYVGFIISSYPYLVPRYITYTQAAADRSTLHFMLLGACIMLPVLLYYTYYSYKIFGGKVTENIEY